MTMDKLTYLTGASETKKINLILFDTWKLPNESVPKQNFFIKFILMPQYQSIIIAA